LVLVLGFEVKVVVVVVDKRAFRLVSLITNGRILEPHSVF
jgi:hypothetical protein